MTASASSLPRHPGLLIGLRRAGQRCVVITDAHGAEGADDAGIRRFGAPNPHAGAYKRR